MLHLTRTREVREDRRTRQAPSARDSSATTTLVSVMPELNPKVVALSTKAVLNHNSCHGASPIQTRRHFLHGMRHIEIVGKSVTEHVGYTLWQRPFRRTRRGLLVKCSADMAGHSSFALAASRHLAHRCFKNTGPMSVNELLDIPTYFSRHRSGAIFWKPTLFKPTFVTSSSQSGSVIRLTEEPRSILHFN